MTDNKPSRVIHPKPMRSAPGGELTPDETVGRERLAMAFWESLDLTSLRIENERRLGKTAVMKLMVARSPEKTYCVFMDVSGVSTPVDFVNEVLKDLQNAIPEHRKSLRSWFTNTIRAVSGLEVKLPGVGLRIPDAAEKHWRRLFKDTIEKVLELIDGRIVFFWDEMPWMLENILHKEGSSSLLELLGTLRDMRLTYENRLRMVFVGSIGFHHVLDELTKLEKATSPLNDVPLEIVPPLEEDDTLELVHRLAAGEGVVTRDIKALGREIHKQTGGVAFFMHYIVRKLASFEQATIETVSTVVNQFLREPDDPWHMRHYRERLSRYDKPHQEWQKAALAVLNLTADNEDPVPFAELLNAVSEDTISTRGPLNKVDLLRLLELLMQDHYLEELPDAPRTYRFKFPLIKRWWQFDQGLDL